MVERKIALFDETEVVLEDDVLTIKGKLGQIERRFSYPLINLEFKDNTFIVSSPKDRKKQKAIVGAWYARIKNMMKGVNEPYVYKLKVVFSHFPMKVKSENSKIVVSNFLGGKGVHELDIPEDIKITINKEDNKEYISVEGINKEQAGLCAAQIERLCVAKKKDRRVFQDGIYIVEKPHKL